MEIIEVKKKALVLDSEEIKKLQQCFAYLYHRKTNHPESYPAKKPKLQDFIDYMRRTLGEMEE